MCEEPGNASRSSPSVLLADIKWDGMKDQEVTLLVWDGLAVGGVELPEPEPDARPIQLRVSIAFVALCFRSVSYSILSNYLLFPS